MGSSGAPPALTHRATIIHEGNHLRLTLLDSILTLAFNQGVVPGTEGGRLTQPLSGGSDSGDRAGSQRRLLPQRLWSGGLGGRGLQR